MSYACVANLVALWPGLTRLEYWNLVMHCGMCRIMMLVRSAISKRGARNDPIIIQPSSTGIQVRMIVADSRHHDARSV